jgi:hypothetical protein
VAVSLGAILPWQAAVGGDLVQFPDDYAAGVRHAVVERAI